MKGAFKRELTKVYLGKAKKSGFTLRNKAKLKQTKTLTRYQARHLY